MTRITLGPGTIRMAMLAVMFVSLTVALIVLQPGPKRDFADYDDREQVSMTNTSALDNDTLPVAETSAEPPAPAPAAAQIAATPPAAPAPRATPAAPQSSGGALPELRQMSWGILQQLDDATGRDTAPGDPGSLLHTIVTRATTDGLSDAGKPDMATRLPRPTQSDRHHDTYKVQPDDTLLVIAQRAYGDPAAFTRIFEANRDLLRTPEDLRPGQVLRLPRP